MTERIISSECLTSIRQTFYEAWKGVLEVYTVRGADVTLNTGEIYRTNLGDLE